MILDYGIFHGIRYLDRYKSTVVIGITPLVDNRLGIVNESEKLLRLSLRIQPANSVPSHSISVQQRYTH